MVLSRTKLFLAWLIIFLLALSGCSGQAAQEPTPTNLPPRPTVTEIPPTPTSIPPTEIPIIFQLSFDGEECTLSGPAEVQPGEMSIRLVDLTDNDNGIWTGLITDGHTYQDLLDMQSEPGDYFRKPDWVVYPTKTGAQKDSEGSRISTFNFTEAGEYNVNVGKSLPASLWFCGHFFVVDE